MSSVEPVHYSASVFVCERLRATLSTAACASNFRQGHAFACSGCPVGREHAVLFESFGEGQATKARIRGVAAQLTPPGGTCVRCERQMPRLVRDRCLCVSCYNRERELKVGLNAKGQRPVLWRGRLHPARAEVRRGTEVQCVELGLCVSVEEIYRTVPRRWPGASVEAAWLD
jgi:hypothetical protein